MNGAGSSSAARANDHRSHIGTFENSRHHTAQRGASRLVHIGNTPGARLVTAGNQAWCGQRPLEYMHRVDNRTANTPGLRVRSPIQLCLVTLAVAASLQPLRAVDASPPALPMSPRSGTASNAIDQGQDAISAGSWADLGLYDPLRIPTAEAYVIGSTVLDRLTRVLQDVMEVADGEHEIHTVATLIAHAPTNPARLEAITTSLSDRQIPYRVAPFSYRLPYGDPVNGTNLIVDIHGAPSAQPRKQLLLTAHYDKTGDDSSGFYDNAVSCATLADFAGKFWNCLPAGIDVQIAFLDAEEQGLFGSRALIRAWPGGSPRPELVINIDLTGGMGREVYVSASNSSHTAWPLAEHMQAARVPRQTAASEASFIRFLRQAASSFNVVQNEAALTSDHLAFQFEGIPAIGIAVMRAGEPGELADHARAYGKFTEATLDYVAVGRELDAQDAGTAARTAAAKRLDASREAWGLAYEAYAASDDASRVLRRVHSGADNEDLYHSRDAIGFAHCLKSALDGYIASLAHEPSKASDANT